MHAPIEERRVCLRILVGHLIALDFELDDLRADDFEGAVLAERQILPGAQVVEHAVDADLKALAFGGEIKNRLGGHESPLRLGRSFECRDARTRPAPGRARARLAGVALCGTGWPPCGASPRAAARARGRTARRHSPSGSSRVTRTPRRPARRAGRTARRPTPRSDR